MMFLSRPIRSVAEVMKKSSSPTVQSPTAIPPTKPAEPIRWTLIDSLRGLSIAGILFVNVPDIVHLGYGLPVDDREVHGSEVLAFLVQTRFVPIFTFLFGVSMYFVLRGAIARGRRGWLALLVRLAVLFGIGMVHSLLYPGEILREYAVAGILILPLVLFLPRLFQLIVAGAGLIAAYLLTGGGVAGTPGLMLLGAAAAAYAIPRALESRARGVVITFLATTVLLVPALAWQATIPGDPRFSTAGIIAGSVMAVWYVTGLSIIWRTRARSVFASMFDPLGRMALTNYLSASVIVFIVSRFVHFENVNTVLPTTLLTVGILVLQSLLSRLWLSRFRYGPLEWGWRMATWREYVPLRNHLADHLEGNPAR